MYRRTSRNPGEETRKMLGMGEQEINRVNCVTGEGDP